jgi:hypothetical protein
VLKHWALDLPDEEKSADACDEGAATDFTEFPDQPGRSGRSPMSAGATGVPASEK